MYTKGNVPRLEMKLAPHQSTDTGDTLGYRRKKISSRSPIESTWLKAGPSYQTAFVVQLLYRLCSWAKRSSLSVGDILPYIEDQPAPFLRTEAIVIWQVPRMVVCHRALKCRPHVSASGEVEV